MTPLELARLMYAGYVPANKEDAMVWDTMAIKALCTQAAVDELPPENSIGDALERADELYAQIVRE